ncbi:TPA: hypothetical protein ACPH36_003009, partial [Pseudomonas aeruginosa]
AALFLGPTVHFHSRLFPECSQRVQESLEASRQTCRPRATAGFHVDPLKWGNFGNLSLKNKFLPLISIAYEKSLKVIIW